MKLLEDRILRDGIVYPGEVLKVDSFLNHQIDVPFVTELGREFHRLYKGAGVTKILTIEASGIGIACLTAAEFGCPVLFAKKGETIQLSPDLLTAEVYSYTHRRNYTIMVAREYLRPDDRILIIDDFLAKGNALKGLIKLVEDAGATLVGVGIAVEKAFQPGGEMLRAEGVRIESLARVASMDDCGNITFC